MIFVSEGLQKAYEILLIGALYLLGVLLFFCILRTIRGPRVADRILSVNMGGTMTITAITILAVILDEGYLVDISLLYAMISFLAVVVLSRIYRGVYLARKDAARRDPAEEDRESERRGQNVS
ncbi:MAG: monovalent cation/H+ antiporter complex subunit F [Bacillota bacterium]|jgi:multicomponent Na+:H+ antiporter subunit F|nr:monovalent cation/H+ antiporter complex subunit F [Eubacteriales bacterium]MDI9491835.1 monovalent cation/H+ antiporter complex subunit F [Bacillota bacterium]NLV70734.1 sodium:proton antiporter [Clostridiales bacterium]MDD3536838.1 monovalent cation/H+ antiporter complex subunit F [Eubacteriales bacterium]MDD4285892.1 monovalent cation/H+ antiporter complex subunit F [Eubacteriales bacterium]